MKTIIQAFIRKENSIDISDIVLFVCDHFYTQNVEVQIPALVGAAFKDWYMNESEARNYVDSNGVNWGDALEIPDNFLRKHGVEGLYPLISGNGKQKIDQIEFDTRITVNHDDELFDLGEADDELDGKCRYCNGETQTMVADDIVGNGVHEKTVCPDCDEGDD
jgi:hypothetical protein